MDHILEDALPEDILNKDGLVDQLKKRLVERALEGEMTDYLGYEKHAVEGRDSGNSRNGKTSKRVKLGDTELDIETPRDGEGSFEPKLVPKGRRRLPGFDDKVIAFYARGMTTREIQSLLKEIYGVDVSPSLISAVTDSVLEDVKAWQSRPLDAVYPVVYLDAIHVKMRSSGHVQNTAVYVALAINMEGKKELLGLWVGEAEGAKCWLSVLTELKNRGVQEILIAAIDGLKGFPEAIESVYAKTQIQLCIVHMIRNSMRYVPWKERKKVNTDVELTDNVFASGSLFTLEIDSGFAHGTGNYFGGATFATIDMSGNTGAADLQYGTIERLEGLSVRAQAGGAGTGVIDLRHNFWGTADSTQIEEWIFDKADVSSDSPMARVLFMPILDRSVRTEASSMGALKGMFVEPR